MLSCFIGNNRINLFDCGYNKEQLKLWAKKDILICPACGKSYEYCHGEINIPYFRHKDKQECIDSYSESETQEHLKGKRDLYEWLLKQKGVTDVLLEGWIPETKQRPDLMFKFYGIQHVLEYQCTPISSEYIERHELYNACGIKDIWICGVKKYFQEYHYGYGSKRLNFLEDISRKYYNSESKTLYFLDKKLDINKKSFKESEYDLACIKDYSLSYSSHSYHKSRKKGWVTEHTYIGNNSYAKYIKLDDLNI